MTPFSIVINLDVVEQAAIRGPVVEPVFVVDQLGLEQMEEGLSHGVIPAVALTAHALHKAVFADPVSESGAGVLNAAIGVDESGPSADDVELQPAAARPAPRGDPVKRRRTIERRPNTRMGQVPDSVETEHRLG